MNLDNRLKACADNVSGKGMPVDVGTDHAYLAAYLVANNICTSVVACDVNEGPLAAARQTVLKYNIEQKVNIVLSDGLKNVSPDGVSDVIIAGMGGELIAKIISDSGWNFEKVNLILQPMTKVHFLRKWLYQNGFEIDSETIVKDAHFIYTVMKVIFSGKKMELNEFQTIVGKVKSDLPLEKEYLLREIKRLDYISDGIKSSHGMTEKVTDLENISFKIREML